MSLHSSPPADLETAPSRDGQELNEFIKALESLRLAQVPPSVTVEEVEALAGELLCSYRLTHTTHG